MADLNGGKGKFTGVDSSVNYDVSFKGATKVAEKVKKGGTENKPDGYVVDAIDIDWGGLKLTTIDNGWNQDTISSTEQNAGKGENTQGIHSTAYLLNRISESFTQIYNQIGGSDDAGLRQKIKTLETSIEQISGSNPGQLADLRKRIKQIEDELDNPSAASTLTTILDTLEGFDKNKKGDVKDYIDTHDQAILGSTADEATAYTVYGVRKYVDTTAKENLVGKPTDTTIDTHYGLKHVLIGNTADTSIDTHWGVKNSLIGTASDTKDSNTIKGAKKYADGVKTDLIGKAGNEWPLQKTMYGLAKYADTKLTDSLLGKEGDKWDAKKTLYGIVKYVDTTAKDNLIGTSTDTTINTHYGLKHILIGGSSDETTADTIWGAKNYADNKVKELYATVDSTGGSHVAVQVVEEDGKVKTVTVTESNFDYEHITGADNKTLKETLENRDLAVSASLTELDGRLDKAVQASVIVEDGENVLVLGAIS